MRTPRTDDRRTAALYGVILCLWAMCCSLFGGPPALAQDVLSGARPPPDGVTDVRLDFLLQDIQEIDDEREAFSWAGILSATWHDPRRAFPDIGETEQWYQGPYQVEELASGWIPRFVHLDALGRLESDSVWLRVTSDGTCTLQRTLHGTTRKHMDMRWFPFDAHELELRLGLTGPEPERVQLLLAQDAKEVMLPRGLRVPEWTLKDTSMQMEEIEKTDRPVLVARVGVQRNSAFLRRLVTFPLSVIVLLSFSVFWMDRAAMPDRVSVSFIGILTAVSYQLMIGESMPPVTYFTLMQGFLMMSFLVMAATVVVNVVVGDAEKRGDQARAMRIDKRCRWAFPLAWVVLVALVVGLTAVLEAGTPAP